MVVQRLGDPTKTIFVPMKPLEEKHTGCIKNSSFGGMQLKHWKIVPNLVLS